MPTYDVKCDICGLSKTLTATFKEYQEGFGCSCGARFRVLVSQSLTVSLKDGESGGWASKAGVERSYRGKRYRQLGERQRDHVKVNRLIPNYKGVEHESWRDAQHTAKTETYREAKGSVGSVEAERIANSVANTFKPLL